MCSPNCGNFPASAVEGAVVLRAAAGQGKCCKKLAKHPHQGGCVSPNPDKFFHDEPAPDAVSTPKDNSPCKEAQGEKSCACGKRSAPAA
jgi:hypothetical protein